MQPDPSNETLYLITPVVRDQTLGTLAETIRPLTQHFIVIWLPVFNCEVNHPEIVGSGCRKRNAALEMIDSSGKHGWIYHLDDDNTIHPSFGLCLKNAIEQNPGTSAFLFPQINKDGSPYMLKPKISPCWVDAGAYVVHSTACVDVRWRIEPEPCDIVPDWDWIQRVCDKGHVPKLVEDGLCFHNGLK